MKTGELNGHALGAFVRSLRRSVGMSQDELARACGISVSRVQALELGAIAHLPAPRQISGISRALDVGEVELLRVAGYRIIDPDRLIANLSRDREIEPSLRESSV